MNAKKIIPTFIIEEHHEAFIVWNYAIQQGWIPATDNCLFHVDEHSDMGTPRFNKSIHNLNGGIKKIEEFTYQELNIASFIIPACYLGIFNQVYWIRQRHKKTLNKPVEMYVRSYNQAGKKLLSGKMKHVNKDTLDNDRRPFDYFLRTIEKIPSNKKVVLDIDLDYFSCSGNPTELEEIYVEITRNEYNQFTNDKYHRLNFSGLGRIEALIIDDKYFYVINNFNEIYPTELKVTESSFIDRINLFVQALVNNRLKPTVIAICRSRNSGYTPIDQWEKIEACLIDKLQNAYNIVLYDVK